VYSNRGPTARGAYSHQPSIIAVTRSRCFGFTPAQIISRRAAARPRSLTRCLKNSLTARVCVRKRSDGSVVRSSNSHHSRQSPQRSRSGLFSHGLAPQQFDTKSMILVHLQLIYVSLAGSLRCPGTSPLLVPFHPGSICRSIQVARAFPVVARSSAPRSRPKPVGCSTSSTL